MSESFNIKPIAYIKSDFIEKFGIPRQSGLADNLSYIIFENEYKNPDYFRGLEGFSHLWIIWQFSAALESHQSPTVRPPRLGGNTRLGVFATRSPFRPNHLALSCVEIVKIEFSNTSAIITVRGADIMNGTPVFDIKPYIPYADSKPDAAEGFSSTNSDYRLNVIYPEVMPEYCANLDLNALTGILAQDPRPSYHNDPGRIYGMSYGELTVKFKVINKDLIVTEISKNRR